MEFFNLDAIFSVGYGVNSKRGTQFRIWATHVLRDHLVRGYTLNERRLAERGLQEARDTLELLASTLRNQALVDVTGQAVLELIGGYADTWRLEIEPLIRTFLKRMKRDPGSVPIKLYPFTRTSVSADEPEPVEVDPRVAIGLPFILAILE